MHSFSVEFLICCIGILQVFTLCVASVFDYVKSSLEPVAIHYDWVTKNIQTPGDHMHFMLARITITTKNGDCIYNKFIKPESRVIDYRTYLTGITENILNNGEDIETVQLDVQKIISNHVIVGYCLHRLLRYLSLDHPIWDKRDTVLYPGFQPYKTIESLKTLAYILLKININNGINSSVESAKAAMKIYLSFKENWDKYMLSQEISVNCPLAIDCEMVAKAGPPGNNDMLARVSLVDINGTCIYDKYVLPTHKVVDYRTRISGIDESKLDDAVSLDLVKQEVQYLTKGKVLVGHDLCKDMVLLGLHHSHLLMRDTSLFTRFRMYSKRRPKLRDLANIFLDVTIQNGAHCSAEDALACMELYKMYKEDWDREIYENELKYVDQYDFTYSNPGYVTPTVAIACSLEEGNTRAKRLNRVSIIDSNLVCIYDKFISKSEKESGDGEPYNRVRHEVDLLLKNKVLIGFNLRTTLSVLSTTASFINRRDALLFDKFHTSAEEITLTGLFKQFVPEVVEKTGTQNSVDEAKKLMTLYLKYKQEWDKFVEEQYTNQFEVTYNVTLKSPLAISNSILKVSNVILLRRVSIVDTNEHCVYDKYIGGFENNGTQFDNDTYERLKNDMKKEILEIVKSNVLIGYNVRYILRSLGISRQWWLLRDVINFSKFRVSNQFRIPLSECLKQGLNLKLTSDYDSVKIAKALMQLYKKFKNEWDKEIKTKYISSIVSGTSPVNSYLS